MIRSILTFLFPIIILCNCGQTQTTSQNKINPDPNPKDIVVGGPCDRCDIMFEGMPASDKINRETTIANKNEPGERLEITGTVFTKDNTPAKNIVLYIYHTNSMGYYTPSDTQTLGRLNGYLRGWVKTNNKGEFKINTTRPAPYPNRNIPAHIHILVKEPGKIRYYIDEVWFDDDPLITNELRSKAEKRGGDLIIHLVKSKNGIWSGNLNITLGLNIPDYK